MASRGQVIRALIRRYSATRREAELICTVAERVRAAMAADPTLAREAAVRAEVARFYAAPGAAVPAVLVALIDEAQQALG